MMEAELFQEIADSIQQHKNHILLPFENPCSIQKIIWSSFDYMAGPELRFVWEGDYTSHSIIDSATTTTSDQQKSHNAITTTNHLGLSQNFDNETVDGCVSSDDSSFSKNTGETSTTRDQFEDIDADNNHLLMSTQRYDNFNENNNLYLLPTEQEPGTSFSQTQPTLTLEDDVSNLTCSFKEASTLEKLEPHVATIKGKNLEVANLVTTEADKTDFDPLNDTMVTSCVDSGIAGTLSMESNLSAYANQHEPSSDVMYRVDNQYCNIRMAKNSQFICKNLHEAQEVIEFDHNVYSDEFGAEETVNATQESTSTNSQLASSFYSTYSSNLIVNYEDDYYTKNLLYKEAEFLTAELSPTDSSGNMLSDEAFVARHVLAEQIGSVQFTTNPILHKFCIVPSRHIVYASYIFTSRHADQPENATAPNLSAFSIIFSIDRAEWYLERQKFFQEIFEDIISRFKAAHLVEPFDDLICRCTRDCSMLFALFGALERWPLTMTQIQKLRIQISHLWELQKDNVNKAEREFIVRCITACLICRGQCTVVGSNSKELIRLMMTLTAFLEPRDRLMCLKPNKLQFNPYLKLQAIKRCEVYQFFEQAANAHWSSSLLDIDRKSVIFTGLYHKHRHQKRMAQFLQVSQIFREAVETGLKVPPGILIELDQELSNGPNKYTLETQVIRADSTINEFMQQICLLPLNNAARISFIDHLHLRIENRAKALITYIKDLSVPSPNDKRSALSSRWHLATVRRNLNLQQDSAYGIALARADSLQSDFAEFIVQQTTAEGRHINH